MKGWEFQNYKDWARRKYFRPYSVLREKILTLRDLHDLFYLSRQKKCSVEEARAKVLEKIKVAKQEILKLPELLELAVPSEERCTAPESKVPLRRSKLLFGLWGTSKDAESPEPVTESPCPDIKKSLSSVQKCKAVS